ncbi:MAG: PAS domain-containing protein [Candidatus Riflebacteria bacterium]|nr:PAS domain-containing protein [Candidatus Riflebacteria bacterium]
MKSLIFQQFSKNLLSQCRSIESQIQRELLTGNLAAIAQFCKSLGEKTDLRISIVLADGKVIADSQENPEKMENHLSRPEITEALEGKISSSTRRSSTLHQNMIYLAIPIKNENKVIGAIRTSVSVAQVEQILSQLNLHISIGVLIISVFCALISFFAYRRITSPLEEISKGVERFAKGEFHEKIFSSSSDDIQNLANSMNQMAEQLSNRIETVFRQRNEQNAILSSMVEGVLAIDENGHVLSLNKACAKILGIPLEKQISKAIGEIVRNNELMKLIDRILSGSEPFEENIVVLEGSDERFLQVHGAALLDSNGKKFGAAFVLNDVTRLKKLENLRRDFVANVSHELKTPITSIKGFVETLLEGAINDPNDAQRFLKIVEKHADRLNSIIEDLLLLSRIEQDAERTTLETEMVPLKDLLSEAIQTCDLKATENNIFVELQCPEDIQVKVNQRLFCQAVVNLIDNAIKYSPSGNPVEVVGTNLESENVITVRDSGCGIPKEHFPRLGERFYRVDKARSRQQGGTGLGLAIVKHIVQAHFGKLSFESEIGKGSSFQIHLPFHSDS